MALLTLWFCQAALNDLASTRRETPSFTICQRVLHQCHEIIFGEPPSLGLSPYSTLSLAAPSRFARRKVRPWAAPALVGMGMALAGAPGIPSVTKIMGEVAIEQGRMDLDGRDIRSVDAGEETTTSAGISPHLPAADEGDESDAESAPEGSAPEAPPAQADTPILNATGLMRRQTIASAAARTSPALPLHLMNIRKSRASMDPLGQYDDAPGRASSTSSPSHSSPSIPHGKEHRRGNTVDIVIQRYDVRSQAYLLRGHYCRSELQFLSALENIANKLLVIPRPARVSALRAELTALNHKLPAEVNVSSVSGILSLLIILIRCACPCGAQRQTRLPPLQMKVLPIIGLFVYHRESQLC
jgi:phosphatidylinositol 4-kinase B